MYSYSLKVTTGPLSATIMLMWPAMKLSLTQLHYTIGPILYLYSVPTSL